MAHDVSLTYARFDHMPPAALALTALLHVGVGLALYWISPLRHVDPFEDVIEVSMEAPAQAQTVLKIGHTQAKGSHYDVGTTVFCDEVEKGTAIEQADMTTRIIDAGASGLVTPRHEEDREAFQNMQWMAVLRSLAAYQMYRRHVRQRVTAEHALRFLLQNNEFPRSVQFCLARAQHVLPTMPARPGVDRGLNRVVGLIRNADPASLAAKNPASFMDEIQVHLGTFHASLADGYFRG